MDAVLALTQSLKDPNQEIRASAAKSLGKMRKMEIVPALTQVLQDELWFVRGAAAEALNRSRRCSTGPNSSITG